MSSIIEEQLASLTKVIEGLAKCAHEQDAKLSKLTNKMDSMIVRRSSQAPLNLPKVQDEGESCGLRYILHGLNPNTFEELATCAHDMELSMTLREDQQSHVYGPHEDENIEELGSGGKSASEDDFEESMYI
uniref:Uncharacterized protein n=1 Tax=Solanum tuberosum TaxID=4113 RepID=M1DKH6_SOLTU